jgi:molybdate/tungstate transport system substrate-binding protein
VSKVRISIVASMTLLVLLASCSKAENSLTVFYAPCYSPVMDALRDECEKTLDVKLVSEISGSQVCCRKVTELGRECDLLMVADSGLLKKIASSHVTWRIDFAHDSVVLGVGIRARRTDEAEKDWVPVLLDENIRLGRVDENLGPIGYRTLLVWALMEKTGHPGLAAKLRANTVKTVDHVAQLATELKAGTLDYGFLYKTTCLKDDIRFISLDDRINLGSPEMDYSGAEVSFVNTQSGRKETVSVKGSHITYGLTIPVNASNQEKATEMVRYLLSGKKDVFDLKGFTFFRSRFYGSREDFKPFESFADYAGEF